MYINSYHSFYYWIDYWPDLLSNLDRYSMWRDGLAMSEWIVYTRSDEQIDEMISAEYGIILRYEDGKETDILF